MSWIDTRNFISTRSTPIRAHNSDNFRVGDKVTVNQSIGTIRYIGTTDFKAGTWIGIELDKIGTGKNDGSIQGKRYFICPPNTGLFILSTKLAKQRYHHRPSTPFNKNIKPSTSTPPPPIPSLPPLPPSKTSSPLPVSKKENLSISTLEKRIQELELENNQLKQTIEKSDSKSKSLKKTSMDSIEILGKMLQSQYDKVQQLNKKNQDLCVEKEVLKKASLDAIELYEVSLKEWDKEKQEIKKIHQNTIDRYLKDIAVLEYVLKSRCRKEADLIELLRKERQHIGKLILEIKSLKHQQEMRWSYRVMDRLDTPIEEDEENHCSLCDQSGHDLLHCQLVQKVSQ